MLLHTQHPETVQDASNPQPLVIGARPRFAFLLDRRARIDAILPAHQTEEFQEMVERVEQVVAEDRIGAESRNVLLGQQGTVGVVLLYWLSSRSGKNP